MADDKQKNKEGWLQNPSLERTKMTSDPFSEMTDEELLEDDKGSRQKWLYLAAVALLIIVLVIIGRSTVFKKRQGKALALLLEKNNRVDYRPAGEVAFLEADIEQSFFAEDAVKTGNKSAAILSFGEENRLNIDENSLIIIRDVDFDSQGKVLSMEVEMPFGKIRSKTSANLSIFDKDGNHLLLSPGQGKNGEMLFERKKGGKGGLLSVYSGTANLSGQKIDSGQGMRLGAKGNKVVSLPPLPKIIAPKSGASFSVPKGRRELVKFQLKRERGVLYDVRVAKDPLFNDLVLRKRQPYHRFSFPFADRLQYYWDVGLVRHGVPGPRSKIRMFKLLDSKSSSVQDMAGTLSSEGKVSKRDYLKFRVASLNGDLRYSRRGGRLRQASVGTYLQQGDKVIVAVDAETELSYKNFTILRVGPYSKISLLKQQYNRAKNRLEVRSKLNQGEVLLHLQPLAGDKFNYQLIVGGHILEFKSVELAGPMADILITAEPSGLFKVLVFKGKCVARIDGEPYEISANKGVSLASDGRFSSVVIDPSRVVSREDSNILVFYRSIAPIVTLSWKGKGGQIAFSKNTDFSELILSENIEQNYFTLYRPRAGKYYWKIRPSGEEKFRPLNAFTVIRTPENLRRSREVVRQSVPVTRIDYSYHTPIIKFIWAKKERVSGYEVEIFSGKNMSRKIYQKTFPGSRISFLTDFLAEGLFYWRVNDISKEGTSYGKYNKLILSLNAESPALEIKRPKDNLLAFAKRYLSRGQMLRKGRLELNGKLISQSLKGPFSSNVSLAGWHNDLIFRVIDEKDRISYYYREIFSE